MARLIVASLLLVAVTFAAAVEARDVHPVVNPADQLRESKMWISRKLLAAEGHPVLLRPLDGANSINASINNMWIQRRLLGVGNANVEDECQRTCDQVKFRTMCRSLTRLPSVKTPRDLLQAAVRVTMSKAKQAKRRVDAYAASYHGGNPMESMLQTCSHAYGSVAESLVETQRLIDSHASNGELNRQLSGVTTDALDCNNAFEERPEIPSPFPGTVRNIYRLADNVLNIAYVIKQV